MSVICAALEFALSWGQPGLGKTHIGTIDDRLRLEPQSPQDPPKGYIMPGLATLATGRPARAEGTPRRSRWRELSACGAAACRDQRSTALDLFAEWSCARIPYPVPRGSRLSSLLGTGFRACPHVTAALASDHRCFLNLALRGRWEPPSPRPWHRFRCPLPGVGARPASEYG